MKNTKKRMEIFNKLSYDLYQDLKFKVKDIHLSEIALSLTAIYYETKQNNFRLYTISIYENYFVIRCSKSYLSKSSRKYQLYKKF